MSQSISQKRPWLAALLGALVTGLGHLYLRRWRRAFGWLVVLFGVSFLFVDPAALEALASGNAVDPATVAPTLFVGSLSVADAYVLARMQNAAAAARAAGPSDEGEATARCPNCGNELDADLEFCHWCTAEIPRSETSAPGDADERER